VYGIAAPHVKETVPLRRAARRGGTGAQLAALSACGCYNAEINIFFMIASYDPMTEEAIESPQLAAPDEMEARCNKSGRETIMSSLERQMAGYRLTTAEILYHLPDHPDLLQSFIWQTLDIAPRYPVLRKFLDYWENNIEGRLHSVHVAQRGVVAAAEFRLANAELVLH